MPNVNAVLNEQIRRLARREISANTKKTKKASAHYRRDIAALKRQVGQLHKLVRVLQSQVPNQPPTPPAEVIQKARLRVAGLKSDRARLGLSAKDYGRLLGVSALTIYSWENGKTKPRRSQLPKIVSVRGIGKREALERLGLNRPNPTKSAVAEPPAPRARQRGKFKQTAEQLIASLLKGRKSLKTSAINLAWKKQGRAGNADNTLSLMVKARKLRRARVKGERGSKYSMA
jgi:transcriptional regulator with XRE-family HTH domain